MAAALGIDLVKALVEQVGAEGLDSIAGKLITTQLGGYTVYTVEIVIENQPGQENVSR
jgi:hypothetical protein